MSANGSRNAMLRSTKDHVAANYGQGPRVPYVNGNNTLQVENDKLHKDLPKGDASEELRNKVAAVDPDLQDLPVGRHFQVANFGNNIVPPKWDGPTDSLGQITGINLKKIQGDYLTQAGVRARVGEFTDQIKRQALLELKNCIEKHLRSILNKNKALRDILDWRRILGERVLRRKRDIREAIRQKIRDFLYNKLKIQQIGEFKQSILAKMRDLCPETSQEKAITRISPTLTRRYQTDQSWRLPDGVNSLTQLGQGSSPTMLNDIEGGNSTGQLVEDSASDIIANISQTAENQSMGQGDVTVSTYFDDNGNMVA